MNKITRIQHHFHHVILCSQHIHIDHDNFMEIIAVKGKATVLKDLADRLRSVKGITQGQPAMTRI